MTDQPAPSTASTASLSRLQELLPQLFQATQLPGQPYLRFVLTEGVGALVPMGAVQESLIVAAEQVTTLPNMTPAVIGLMSSREQVLCLVSLAQMLGYPSTMGSLRQYPVIVVRVPRSKYQGAAEGETLLGLAVSHIQGVVRLEPNQLQAKTELCPTNLNPYVVGTSQLDGQLTYILDVQTLSEAPSLYSSTA
ncbi:hypothetical protein C1752_02112 [Acaryochloris thomasi RCC1774]|uniref:CheW-like domain-containing protein n=1 Tax=Acaryochloris thomasi RCC1774 TaxID=1764569 RepID=A0A2W1JK31_9CYAN|nr:chemotaxis protein CheW [Acaryochloris thomasi]PZD73586.1 hypothetical protein C1752_02112 [Acaryochloris thomasi RCC1774]